MKISTLILFIFLMFMYGLGYHVGRKSVEKEKLEKATSYPKDDYRYKEHCAGC